MTLYPSNNRFKSLFIVNKNLSLEKFLELAGIENKNKNSYPGQLFSMLYHCVFSTGKDVTELYNTYFKPEYDNFEDFIRHYYYMTNIHIQEIMNELSRNKDFILLDVPMIDYNQNFINLMDDTRWQKRLCPLYKGN